MDTQTLGKYLHAFGNLHQNKGIAPHKPILLLSILDEIGRGRITDNEIVLAVELVAAFREYWQTLPLPPGNWLERSYLPYRYLLQDGFWQLVKNGEALTGKEVGEPTSIPDTRARIHYARFDAELWALLQDTPTREAFRAHLLQTYFGILPSQVQALVIADPLAAQVDKLIANAQSQPKPKAAKVVKESSDLDYLRQQLFAKVLYAVYDNACAICDLRVRIGDSRVLTAIHIKQFSKFGNNHPSNGLALCFNHHWAFDRGGISVADDYTVLVSPQLTGTTGFVTPGAPMRLPSSDKCHPDPECLAWHRTNIFKP